ncbi:MAG TPA: glycosyl hydrolase family 8 [Bauldia sp.]|nr:glycosyl hydrolase family 8 [Bauldia sp.]
MIRLRAGIVRVLAATAILAGAEAAAAIEYGGSIATDDWAAYRERFVTADGRVVDDANDGISHSEGQGYGLLLAYSAGDRGTFERIFDFTRNQLLIRDDGLAAWKWDPSANPHIVDVNNASDGDILIAYALGIAGKTWGEPRYTEAAAKLAKAIGTSLLAEVNGRVVLKPGVTGFAPPHRPDGTIVVNPSYWVFEAFPTLKELAPDFAWDELASSGAELVASARFGEAGLPADWVTISADGLEPAEGFPTVFGYNAIRIPLYLMRAGVGGAFLDPFANRRGLGEPAVIELTTGKDAEKLTDPGYMMIDALVACSRGTPVPDNLKHFAPTSYYPSTLHLLGLSYLAARQGKCA